MAVKGGLDSDSALEAITINAAEIAGIDDTTGSIAVGKDADLQLYCGNPLDIMNDPELVHDQWQSFKQYKRRLLKKCVR